MNELAQLNLTALTIGVIGVATLTAVIAFHVIGVRRLASRFASHIVPPANTRLYRGHLGYVGSAWLQVGSCDAGLYIIDLFFPRGVLIPWSHLERPHRFGPLTWYWLREFRLPIVVWLSPPVSTQPVPPRTTTI